MSVRAKGDKTIRCLLIDPSLFTAPYDAELSRGLVASNVEASWATRRLRSNERAELEHDKTPLHFYRLTDGPNRRTTGFWRAIKGLEHIWGLYRLLKFVASQKIDVVHFQWGVLPSIDRHFIRKIKRLCPVVLTVHDTTPFNGKAVNALQKDGFESLLQSCDHIIVHTAGAKAALSKLNGLPPISVVPHGLLPITTAERTNVRTDEKWHVVMFGKIQHYKGTDILVDALGRLSGADRERIRVIIAGEALIPLQPIRDRAMELVLSDCLDIREGRLSEEEMADLFAQADCFVFPYREIEASGVLFLIANQQKWIIASDLGAFRETIADDDMAGELIPPENPDALGVALINSIGRKPTRSISKSVPSWEDIGRRTRTIYENVINAHPRFKN